MQAERKVIRSALLAAGVVAVGVAIIALREVGGRNPDAWATIAAVLAVIAPVISAWTTQRVRELQEDALEPNLQAAIDARRRYGLVQFCDPIVHFLFLRSPPLNGRCAQIAA